MKTKYIVGLIAGLFLPLGFEPFGLWGLTLVSLALLIFLLENLDKKQSFKVCFTFGLGYWLSGISWVYVSIHYHGNQDFLSSSLITLLFIICLSVYTGMVGLLYHYLSIAKNYNEMVIFPVCWFAIEIIRSSLFTGFPWLLIGTTLSGSILDGWISVIGSQGNTLILATLSGSLVVVYRNIKSTKPLFFSSLVVLTIIFSSIFIKSIHWTTPYQEVTASVYQPNLTLEEKWSYEGITKTKNLIEESLKNSTRSELIIFPETALIQTEKVMEEWLSKINEEANSKEVSLLTGIMARNEAEITNNQMRNRIIGLGKATGSYDKIKLVPFGEFIPFEGIIGNLLDFMGLNITSTLPGNQYNLIESGDLKIAPSICYEIAFGNLVNNTAKQANILVTISNDTWFGESIGPVQHLQIAVDRALEHQKPVLRSTNSGFSAIIDNKGNIIAKSGFFEEDRVKSTLMTYSGHTPYASLGNLIGYIYAIISIMLWLCIKRTKVYL